MQIRTMVIVASVGMAMALPCLAQNAPGGGGGGGMISMKADSLAAEVDTNKDGKLSKEEWKAAGLADFVLTRLDTDKKGYITQEQLEATKFPADMDTDKSGKLSVAKLIAFDKKMSSSMSGGAPGGGGAPSGGAPGGGAPQN